MVTVARRLQVRCIKCLRLLSDGLLLWVRSGDAVARKALDYSAALLGTHRRRFRKNLSRKHMFRVLQAAATHLACRTWESSAAHRPQPDRLGQVHCQCASCMKIRVANSPVVFFSTEKIRPTRAIWCATHSTMGAFSAWHHWRAGRWPLQPPHSTTLLLRAAQCECAGRLSPPKQQKHPALRAP